MRSGDECVKKNLRVMVGTCRTRILAVGDEAREIIGGQKRGRTNHSTVELLECHQDKEADSQEESNMIKLAYYKDMF